MSKYQLENRAPLLRSTRRMAISNSLRCLYTWKRERETPVCLKEKELRISMEQQVYRIWTYVYSLSAFTYVNFLSPVPVHLLIHFTQLLPRHPHENKKKQVLTSPFNPPGFSLHSKNQALRGSDMLPQISNGAYLDSLCMAEKFILHVEVLFGTIDNLEWVFAERGVKGMFCYFFNSFILVHTSYCLLSSSHRDVPRPRSPHALPKNSRPLHPLIPHAGHGSAAHGHDDARTPRSSIRPRALSQDPHRYLAYRRAQVGEGRCR